MGYYISTNATNSQDIRQALGSKSEKLFNQIQANPVFGIYHDDDKAFFEDLPLDKALQRIIYGKVLSTIKAKHMYGYAFICLCKTLGQATPYYHEIKLWAETAEMNQLLADFGLPNFDIENRLFDDNSLDLLDFGIPVADDFPVINILTKEQMLSLKQDLDKVTISQQQITDWEKSDTDDDEERAFAGQHINGLKQNLAFCLANNLNLCLFCH